MPLFFVVKIAPILARYYHHHPHPHLHLYQIQGMINIPWISLTFQYHHIDSYKTLALWHKQQEHFNESAPKFHHNFYNYEQNESKQTIPMSIIF